MPSMDRNANDATRVRRNAQRQRAGDGTKDIKIAAPLTNAGTLGLALAAAGGLQVTGNQLAVKLDGAGALAVGGSGIAVVPDGSTIVIASDKIGVPAGGIGTSQLAAAAVTPAKLAISATTPTLEDDGAGALRVKIDGQSVRRGTSGLFVGSSQLLSTDPVSPVTGDAWFNTTSDQAKVNLVTTSGNALPSALVASMFGGSNSSTISNTTAFTAFTPSLGLPAGFLNRSGRLVRITVVLGGGGVAGSAFTLFLRYGGSTVWQFTYSGTNMSSAWVEILLTTTATGATGSLLAIGKTFSGSLTYSGANFVTTVDLTASAGLLFAGQWGTANVSNAAQLSLWNYEVLA